MNNMDVKQKEMFETKQGELEEVMIKEEYVGDLDLESTSAPTFSMPIGGDFTGMKLKSEDCSYQLGTTSTITSENLYQCFFNTSNGDGLKIQQEYFCTYCNFKTSRKDHLKRHTLTHSSEKPHHCKQCDFKTSRKDHLRRHMVTHSGEKPHHCEQCDFRTSRKDHLRRHMVTHGEKLNKQSDLKTFQKGYLEQLMLTHSGENSNHSGLTPSPIEKIYSTVDGFNENTKDSDNFMVEPEQTALFNSMDPLCLVKEEPNDSDETSIQNF